LFLKLVSGTIRTTAISASAILGGTFCFHVVAITASVAEALRQK
jgi:hypothetical protein